MELAAPAAPALPTCELRAEDLRVVDDVLPELLKLGYPCNVLQQPHKVPADHEAVHELGKGEEITNLIYCLPAPEQGEGRRHRGGRRGREEQSVLQPYGRLQMIHSLYNLYTPGPGSLPLF